MKRTKRLTALGMAVVLAAGTLAGCGSGKEGSVSTTAAGQNTPVSEGTAAEKVKLKVSEYYTF